MKAIKKNTPAKKNAPVVELKPTGKKNKKGEAAYHLHINGKTDKAIYYNERGTYCMPTHSEKFTLEILKLRCRDYPKDAVGWLKLKSSFTNGIVSNDREVLMMMDENKFNLTVFPEFNVKEYEPFIYLNEDTMAEDLVKTGKKYSGKNFRVLEDLGYISVMIYPSPDETIGQATDRLITFAKKITKLTKLGWLKEVKKLVRDLE